VKARRRPHTQVRALGCSWTGDGDTVLLEVTGRPRSCSTTVISGKRLVGLEASLPSCFLTLASLWPPGLSASVKVGRGCLSG